VKCKALYIDVLFVEDGWRGSGIGAKLLYLIEKTALDYGARYFYLNTGSFQTGLTFYEKNGYKSVFERKIWTTDGDEYIDFLMVKVSA
jgi:GNAT superfamily N-acetyltransferase